MILAILAAGVIAADPPTATPAPASAAAASSASAASLSPSDQVRELQFIYAQSCGDRAYGSYNDACDQIRRQIKDAEKAARRAARSAR